MDTLRPSSASPAWDTALRISSALPLVECQLHLVSSLPPEFVASRAAAHGVRLAPCAPGRLGPLLRTQLGFRPACAWLAQFLQSAEDLRDGVGAVVRHFAQNGQLRWLELHLCPQAHVLGGMTSREVVAHACQSFRAAAGVAGLGGGLVLVSDASQAISDGHETVLLAAQHASQGVLGVQLAACGYPHMDLSPWHGVASAARAAEVPLCVHVSEDACSGGTGGGGGPGDSRVQDLNVALRNVELALEWGAVRLSGAQCLRHRCETQQAVAEARIPLVTCLTHSCRTRDPGWPRFAAQHPIGSMLSAGLLCIPCVGHSFLTEQPWPAGSGSSHASASSSIGSPPLACELATLIATCGLSWLHIRTLLIDAARMTLRPPSSGIAQDWISAYVDRLDAALALTAALSPAEMALVGAAGDARLLHGLGDEQHYDGGSPSGTHLVSSPSSTGHDGAYAAPRVLVPGAAISADAVFRPQDDPSLLLRRSALMPRSARFKTGPADGASERSPLPPKHPQTPPPPQPPPRTRAPSPGPPVTQSTQAAGVYGTVLVPPRWAFSLPSPRVGEDSSPGSPASPEIREEPGSKALLPLEPRPRQRAPQQQPVQPVQQRRSTPPPPASSVVATTGYVLHSRAHELSLGPSPPAVHLPPPPQAWRQVPPVATAAETRPIILQQPRAAQHLPQSIAGGSNAQSAFVLRRKGSPDTVAPREHRTPPPVPPLKLPPAALAPRVQSPGSSSASPPQPVVGLRTSPPTSAVDVNSMLSGSPSDPSYVLPTRGKLSETRLQQKAQALLSAESSHVRGGAQPRTHVEAVARAMGIDLSLHEAMAVSASLNQKQGAAPAQMSQRGTSPKADGNGHFAPAAAMTAPPPQQNFPPAQKPTPGPAPAPALMPLLPAVRTSRAPAVQVVESAAQDELVAIAAAVPPPPAKVQLEEITTFVPAERPLARRDMDDPDNVVYTHKTLAAVKKAARGRANLGEDHRDTEDAVDEDSGYGFGFDYGETEAWESVSAPVSIGERAAVVQHDLPGRRDYGAFEDGGF